ncbi:MAG: sigma-70 family RNA polymerase sigma factor [Candidatus Eisenbacteria bacterium]|uniref:Sigma-70 family RNA polymerase sigma factor n=1 Tax=Eiseniibacteriota bacterium TaxID=2212470 RepID=A0A956SBR9_UNCEI|nr:sigma-70 family RNA polymerase sigma factor [Candidatus Eisenbacteria bacterium]MCB9465058.1 sigma-70 family RNA polymerase sigma factor [Candidatus Eisenbacteria bacterium]
MERCLAGEEEAFRMLVERYDRRVYATIYRLVGSEPDARDLTQETFLRFFRSLDRFDSSRSLSAWLLRIASNQTVDFLRKRRIDTVSLDEEGRGEVLESLLQTDAWEDSSSDPNRERLEHLVTRLAPGYRIVLELRHAQGLQPGEIAEILDVTPATVRSRLHRAHRQLAGWLQGKDLSDL